ncbi:cysteine hydrolase family protein [Cryptosporangium sp. NPDC048952]|uniref:cysteine hydrolase family protein n=1 Tax=Cryptosporangium sp. NPDC048952 TaxID=3363961 RepID=UPI00371B48A4
MPVSVLDGNVALVVVDLQNATVAQPGLAPLSGAEVVANTVRLAEAFRAAGQPVVLVRDVSLDGSDGVPGRSEFGSGAGRVLPEGWDAIVPGLEGDFVVSKRNWGAFYGTELDDRLRRRGVTQVVVAGVATSIGVDSTARGAHERGYHVVVVSDAVTDVNRQAHELAVGWTFRILGELGTVAEIGALLEQRA